MKKLLTLGIWSFQGRHNMSVISRNIRKGARYTSIVIMLILGLVVSSISFFPSVIALAEESRFSILSEFTVKDNKAGLTWTRSANIAGKPLSYDGSIEFIKKLNKQNYAGFSDWRLPSVHEFINLMDYSRYKPALPGVHPFIDVQVTEYWTSTHCAHHHDNVWTVSVNHGNVSLRERTISANIWIVR
ncbi:MAG: DUF1566 domain-containing protein [Nitrospirae bacterium]|uniref:Lcl C-terminal domain-containing protein n=1 Tax=Candidatus Magnetobacterium casense TaxID=1455061 RepID=UPI00058FBBB4|nr:DUF1566 domain-containing protein [Candidatus Magnetobacterium casensis]MBF0336845.1 DUF1566 domain-containing protein [Nitrospirota bacterium]